MKFLVVSDLHERDMREVVPELVIEKADYIVSAGDYNCYPFPRPAVGVYGNHDDSTEVFQNKTMINCHKKVVEVAGLTFLGVQGVFSTNPHKWYHQLESDIQRFLEKQPRVNVFITHERAAGIFDRLHSGSPAFRDYVLEKHPDYYISGHVCADGTILRKGHTVCLNAHPCGAHRYILLEVETGNLELVDVATHCWPEKRSRPSENKSAKRTHQNGSALLETGS